MGKHTHSVPLIALPLSPLLTLRKLSLSTITPRPRRERIEGEGVVFPSL